MDPELKERLPKPDESKWTIEQREVLHKNSWHQYMHDYGKTDSGKEFNYFYTDIGGSVAAVALTAKRELILVRQYRYLTNRDSLEVPSGGVEDGESSKEALVREFKEETGYEAGHILELGDFDVANGTSNDIAKIYLLSGCKKSGNQKLEATEEGMTVELYSIEDVFEQVQDGKITDGFTLAALMLAWPHLL